MDILELKLKFTCFLRQGYEVVGEQRHPVLLPSGGGEGSARDETLELCRASLVHLLFLKIKCLPKLDAVPHLFAGEGGEDFRSLNKTSPWRRSVFLAHHRGTRGAPVFPGIVSHPRHWSGRGSWGAPGRAPWGGSGCYQRCSVRCW